MRSAVLVLAALALAACEPGLTSSRPLLRASGPSPLPGLWALLDAGCARPASPAFQTWPSCAAPLWLSRASVTMVLMQPRRVSMTIAAGQPTILQLGWRDPASGEQKFDYFGAEPLGPPPYRRARVWPLPCRPAEALPGGAMESAAEAGELCAASSSEMLASAARQRPPRSWTAVWIAPSQTDAGSPM